LGDQYGPGVLRCLARIFPTKVQYALYGRHGPIGLGSTLRQSLHLLLGIITLILQRQHSMHKCTIFEKLAFFASGTAAR
jgi:hypothetical protein